jgi:hypothetical protein
LEELVYKKNTAGQWLVLPEEKKKAISDFLEGAERYEGTLGLVGDTAEFYVEKVKPEMVSVEGAKAALRSISDQFDEKKKIVSAALQKIEEKVSIMNGIISELDPDRFQHRIESIQVTIDKFKPHIERFNSLIIQIDERKKEELEKAKNTIMKGHRKFYFENLR